MSGIEHWWCRECGTFDGPKGDGDCDVCWNRNGNLIQVEHLVPADTSRGAVGAISEVPDQVRSLLCDSLTERGMGQWWSGRSRYLNGKSPAECWETDPGGVIGAAAAFDLGYYL
jgi:hypothetical protein